MAKPTTRRSPPPGPVDGTGDPILDAAFRVFAERGLEGATTLEIARRARTSKRTLYERFGSKEGIFAALVENRAARMRAPLALAEPASSAELQAVLVAFGTEFLSQLVRPTTIALYRLVLAHGSRGQALARALDEAGRGTVIGAVTALFDAAGRRQLVAAGDPARPAATFLGLLVGDLVFRLVMGVAETPEAEALRDRSRNAAAAALALHRAGGGGPP
jgi:AcrR family transcriptional regulator